MHDDEIVLCNRCADLVGEKKWEAFPRHLLQVHRAGEWIGARELARQIGLTACDLKPELFATWLPDPMSNSDYVVILFYDDDSKWSMTAMYNRARLINAELANQKTAATVAVSRELDPIRSGTAAEL